MPATASFSSIRKSARDVSAFFTGAPAGHDRATLPALTREEAKQDVFDYIEMFYNSKRRHSFSNDLSPVEYEKQYFQRLASV